MKSKFQLLFLFFISHPGKLLWTHPSNTYFLFYYYSIHSSHTRGCPPLSLLRSLAWLPRFLPSSFPFIASPFFSENLEGGVGPRQHDASNARRSASFYGTLINQNVHRGALYCSHQSLGEHFIVLLLYAELDIIWNTETYHVATLPTAATFKLNNLFLQIYNLHNKNIYRIFIKTILIFELFIPINTCTKLPIPFVS